MKYLLISKQTGEQTLCDKVTIDGFDYYVSDDKILNGDYCVHPTTLNISQHSFENNLRLYWKKAIATNNPNLDIPQVVDEAKEINLAFKQIACTGNSQFDSGVFHGFVACYHKCQETHPFSEEDLIEFNEWCETSAEANLFWRRNRIDPKMSGSHHKIRKQKMKELLQLWKEQQPQKIYYTQAAAK